MLAEGHRRAAEDIENTTLSLQAIPSAARMVIEGAWGAAFHWIAFGCAMKYQKHRDSHIRLGTYLRSQGELAVAEWWEDMERVRQGGWYGNSPEPATIEKALAVLEKIHSWASQ
jgi:hypothetical protein